MIKTKKLILLWLAIFSSATLFAQPTIMPADTQAHTIIIRNATIHVGNGQVIEKGTVTFTHGIIDFVGTGSPSENAADAVEIDASGKHVYPGFIAPNTTLGLVEFSSVRASVDFAETGENNAHVRSLIAYNTDSKVINTLRSNGILLAQVTPQRGLISGQSSVVQLDAWNWEDAAYATDDGLHVNWPEWRVPRSGNLRGIEKQRNAVNERIDAFQEYLLKAKAYLELDKPETINARFEAFRGIFSGSKRLFVHANEATGILTAVNTLKPLGITPVIVGGREANLVLSLLKENKVPVIIRDSHALPSSVDEDVNAPYKQAKVLYDAGILAAYSIDGFWQQRNLPFIAGTAVAFGLDKEAALQFITLNTAKILGIDKRTGSLEAGKEANLFISDGDALDMRTNKVEAAFIQGRQIDLDNLHKQLFERYKTRYHMSED